MAEECIFCKIIDGEIPGAFVHKDDRAVVFLDVNQAAKGHLLIVPREHRAGWHDLDEAIASHLATLSSKLAPALLESVRPDGYNILLNNGKAAGQEVMHVHLHIIPRWEGDGYFGRGPAVRRADGDELSSTADAIKAAMGNGPE